MGAETRGMGARERALAAEGIRQRRAAIGQRAQEARQQATPEAPEAVFAQASKGEAPVAPFPSPATRGGFQNPVPGELNPGLVFGPGRARRMPERGTPDYQAMIDRIRNMGQR